MKATSADDKLSLKFEMVRVDDIIEGMTEQSKVSLVFLDACRNNPLSRSLASRLGATRSTSVGRGMAPIDIEGSGVLIAYATAPDNVVLDGEDGNSPFTRALLKYIGQRGLELRTMMTKVKADVVKRTQGRQRPWDNSDLTELVYLAGE